jgi:hypothetical protein
LADVEYRLGNYDKVMSFDLMGPDVQALKVEAAKVKEGKIRVKDHVVAGEILGLALRTYVQKGDLDNAKAIFGLLERLAPEDGDALEVNATNVLFALVADVEHHLKTLEKANDPAKLKEALDNYSKFYGSFIDSFRDSLLSKRSEPKDYILLANAYATLKQPQKAVELFAKVPTPQAIKDVDDEVKKRAETKKLPLSDDDIANWKAKLVDEELKKQPEFNKKASDEKEAAELKARVAALRVKLSEDQLRERQEYWGLQIQYGKALRESKDYKKAYLVLDRLTKHPFGEYHIPAEMLKNEVLEDSNLFGPAIDGWKNLTTRLRDAAAKEKGEDKPFTNLYFESYFHNARCWYKFSQSEKVLQSDKMQKTKKEEQFLGVAANYIFRLENATNKDGWNIVGGRFQELMAAEPKLKAAYDRLKKATAAQAAPAGK